MNILETLGLPNGTIISLGDRITFFIGEIVKEGDCLLIRSDNTLVVGIPKNKGCLNGDGTKYYSDWYLGIPVKDVVSDN